MFQLIVAKIPLPLKVRSACQGPNSRCFSDVGAPLHEGLCHDLSGFATRTEWTTHVAPQSGRSNRAVARAAEAARLWAFGMFQTTGLEGRRSIHLSYSPTESIVSWGFHCGVEKCPVLALPGLRGLGLLAGAFYSLRRPDPTLLPRSRNVGFGLRLSGVACARLDAVITRFRMAVSASAPTCRIHLTR